MSITIGHFEMWFYSYSNLQISILCFRTRSHYSFLCDTKKDDLENWFKLTSALESWLLEIFKAIQFKTCISNENPSNGSARCLNCVERTFWVARCVLFACLSRHKGKRWRPFITGQLWVNCRLIICSSYEDLLRYDQLNQDGNNLRKQEAANYKSFKPVK